MRTLPLLGGRRKAECRAACHAQYTFLSEYLALAKVLGQPLGLVLLFPVLLILVSTNMFQQVQTVARLVFWLMTLSTQS